MLSLQAGSVVSIIGCGGKTTLLARLWTENRPLRVLLSTTTHIRPMQDAVGVYNADSGKLGSLPAASLAALVPTYDLTLLEADGSRGLPLKGWREDEPVVPLYTTHTVGVVTLRALGAPLSEANCLRVPLFTALTGVSPGMIVTPDALTRMVCAPGGMFTRAAGDAYLLVNQVEDDAARQAAAQWLASIAAAYPGRFAGLLYGSLHNDRWDTVP